MDKVCVHISVVYSSGPRNTQEVVLQMPPASTVADAVRASRLLEVLADAAVDQLTLGVWGRKAGANQLLNDGDRVEMYRPLLVDPKVARRERFTRQGAKSAGLFANRRPGAKAGY
jgi:putative ubiquitin-RnfH superfamily antitoxin RatB of RatAB toxin-antitoxin module